MPERCGGWTASSIGSGGPITRPTMTSAAVSSGAPSAGRCPNARGRCWRGGARCTGSWPPPASAARGNSPTGYWRWVTPSSWSNCPIEPGRGPTGSRSSSVRPGCLSHACLSWLRGLAGPSCRSMPGEHGYRKRVPVAGSRRKPARSAGISALAAPVPNGISSPPSLPASWRGRHPCSTQVAPRRRGRGGSPPVPPAYEQAISNQPARGRRLPAAFGRPPGAVPSQSGSAGSKGRPVGSESAEV